MDPTVHRLQRQAACQQVGCSRSDCVPPGSAAARGGVDTESGVQQSCSCTTECCDRILGFIAPHPRAKRPVHVPVVLNTDEVRRVLRELKGVPWLVASLLYGAGLRLQECLELRVKDLDFERREITVRRGKGRRTVA